MATSDQARHDLELVILTGMSGAGRTTAARALEDLGWFVVDNIPPTLLGSAVDLAATSPDIHRMAVVVDARGGSFFAQLSGALTDLPREGMRTRLVFLEASDEALVRRFESSRRPHPLQQGARILDGLRREREVLSDLRASADLVIDTTGMNVHDLRRRMDSAFDVTEDPSVQLIVMSFGFKYGIPVDADMVMDARFIPNPYWDPALRELTGRDNEVSTMVLSQAGVTDFIDHVVGLVATTTSGYISEGKRFATLAIGCTGGKHRSVAIVERVAELLRARGIASAVVHRDLGKE